VRGTVWVDRVEVRDLRNIREAKVELGPGLNVFWGQNAQGKTSFLETVGLIARGRSFRTEHTESLIRRGAPSLWARGVAKGLSREATLEVELRPGARRLLLNGSEAAPRSYHGRLEVMVYSTDRLKVVRGTMRDRRQFLDRTAAVLLPAYKQVLREYERLLLQRNAALERGGRDLDAWTERLSGAGAELRSRRGAYVSRLQKALLSGFRPSGEHYALRIDPELSDEAQHREHLDREFALRRKDEFRARRTLVGPHRDVVHLQIDGEDAAATASSGQARSLLLALTVATLDVHREETGEAAVALLDDLDSELDFERTAELAQEITRRGQALVTTAHRGWADRLSTLGPQFQVAEGAIAPLSS
jgi:DNA replication and repair protein RecF